MAWPDGQTTKQALGAWVEGGDYDGVAKLLGTAVRYRLRYAPKETRSGLQSTIVGFASQGNGDRTGIHTFSLSAKDRGFGKDNKAYLRDCANGGMDSAWKAYGQALRERAQKLGGWYLPDGRPRWIDRVAWEATGDWYWTHYLVGAETEFRDAFRRYVEVVNTPEVPKVYALANGKGTIDSVERAYAGDDYVDVVETDVYQTGSGYPKATHQVVWDRKRTGMPNSPHMLDLELTAQFALDHGKPFALGETGVWDRRKPKTQDGGGDAGDLWFPWIFQWVEGWRKKGLSIAYINMFLQDYPDSNKVLFHDIRKSGLSKSKAGLLAALKALP